MITADSPVFPNNVVDLVATRAGLIDPDLVVVKRPLRSSDPVQSVGVLGAQWNPENDSTEMRGKPVGWSEPTISTYLIAVQAFIKDMDEERGLAVHSVLSQELRVMLYRDDALRVGLSQLSVQRENSIERTQRWGIRAQRFFSNEIDASWLYLSTLEFWLETETV